MTLATLRQAASLFFSLSLCAPIRAQQPQSSPAAPNSIVRPDPRRAQKLVERGEKAEADGRIDEALLSYDEAARLAPQDLAVVGRGAVLRSRLIREHVDKAEQLALAGKLPQAKEELTIAIRIDPSNKIVAERYAQMDSMHDDEPSQAAAEISGLPHLKTQAGEQSFYLHRATRHAYPPIAQTIVVKVTSAAHLGSRHAREPAGTR